MNRRFFLSLTAGAAGAAGWAVLSGCSSATAAAPRPPGLADPAQLDIHWEQIRDLIRQHVDPGFTVEA